MLLGYTSCLWKFMTCTKSCTVCQQFTSSLRGNHVYKQLKYYKHIVYGGIPHPTGSYLARRASAATSPPSMGTPGAAATSWRPWLTLVSRLGEGEPFSAQTRLSAWWRSILSGIIKINYQASCQQMSETPNLSKTIIIKKPLIDLCFSLRG